MCVPQIAHFCESIEELVLQSTLLPPRLVVHASLVVLVLGSRGTCFQKTNNVVCVFCVHATLGFRAFYINEIDICVVLSPLVLAS